LSISHSNVEPVWLESKLKSAAVALVGSAGWPPVMFVSGAVVSTVQVWLSVASLPAASVTRTVTVWESSLRPV
jgi:hypothetical protein